jgi:hypothetical protein
MASDPARVLDVGKRMSLATKFTILKRPCSFPVTPKSFSFYLPVGDSGRCRTPTLNLNQKLAILPVMRGTGINAFSSLSGRAGLSNISEAQQSQTIPADKNSTEKLRIATWQFPVSGSAAENAKYIRAFMHEAVGEGANLRHTSEASLSGYGGSDIPTFEKYDWDELRKEIADLRALRPELPGYPEYCLRTRFRLVPLIW